jgi:acyl-CoA thioester hydrolase
MTAETFITVRYAETDKMGIVHHSNYAVWFEAGRGDFLKKAGVSYSEVEKRGLWLPLYELTCRYKSPARYEDELIIRTRVKELTRVRLVLSYEVVRRCDHKLLATGETLHAFTGPDLKPLNVEKALPDVYALLKVCAEA